MPGGARRDEHRLLGAVRVELKRRSGPALERPVQRREETNQPGLGHLLARLRVTQPLLYSCREREEYEGDRGQKEAKQRGCASGCEVDWIVD